MMKKSDIISIGFMLFAMFFGAGNLIFPPELSFHAGQYFLPAILGFIITGVGLPLIGVLGGAISSGGYRNSFKVVSPFFSRLLLIIIYLAIGPFFAIPRTATTSYEMSILPVIGVENNNTFTLALFSLFFFGLTLYVTLGSQKISDVIGKYLTPVLLIAIAALIVMSFIMYWNNDVNAVSDSFNAAAPFATGFTEGYLTMDAIAAVAFSMIVLYSIQEQGVSSRKELIRGMIQAAIIAAALLFVIYGSLGWIGNRINLGTLPEDVNLGAHILITASNEAFGSLGVYILGLIVFLACLTTSSGLIASVSEYFYDLYPKISYKVYAYIFTGISFVLSIQGLDAIIQGSVPLLSIIYPIVITTVLLIIWSRFFPSTRFSIQLPVILVSIVSILSLFHRSGWINFSMIESLPLYQASFEWLLFAVGGYLLGYLVSFKQEKVEYD